MAKVPRECARCRRVKLIQGRDLCVGCYDYERKHNNLGNYKTRQSGDNIRYDNCQDCGEYAHIFGRDRCKSCYNRWYQSKPKNRKRATELERKRREKNREHYRELDKKRQRTKKRKQWKEKYNRKYYATNASELKQYQVEWRQNNKEIFSGYMRQAAMRRKKADGVTTEEQWADIVEFYCPENKCLCCKKEFDNNILERKVTVDHIIPISKGGTHWPDNIQPICYSCNCSKGNYHTTDYRPDKGKFARSLM